ncbi:signal peptidase I [Microgenomates group bacterium RBG_16_45_19]|nr:MAG: signal peptidase I [Microgenomates group bacterium RBG_16_45_19]
MIKTLTHALNLSLQILFSLLVVVVGTVWILGRTGTIAPVTPLVVLSGSMAPSIPTGAVVLVQAKPFGYKTGDIITFSRSAKDFTTHRVAALADDQGAIVYSTKGDANDSVDTQPVSLSQIKGSVFLTLPYLGYAVNYAKKPYGFILLVIIPSTIIVYEELKTIGSETKKAIKKFRRPQPKPLVIPVAAPSFRVQVPRPQVDLARQPHPLANLPQPPSPPKIKVNAPLPPAASPLVKRYFAPFTGTAGALGYSQLSLIIPLAAAAFIFVGVSGAYLADTESSFNNLFGAGLWGVQPLRTSLPEVIPSPTSVATPSASPSAALME